MPTSGKFARQLSSIFYNHRVYWIWRLWHLYNKTKFTFHFIPFFSGSIQIIFDLSYSKTFQNQNDRFLIFLCILDLVEIFQSFRVSSSSFLSRSPRIHFLVTISMLIKNFARFSIPFFLVPVSLHERPIRVTISYNRALFDLLTLNRRQKPRPTLKLPKKRLVC